MTFDYTANQVLSDLLHQINLFKVVTNNFSYWAVPDRCVIDVIFSNSWSPFGVSRHTSKLDVR